MRGGDKQTYLFDPPTSSKKREPGEGEVESGRGKKAKKWHLTLGLKDVVFAGFGVVGLLCMSFALGALAGRGDIYRAAYSWGLLCPEAKHAAQLEPPAVTAPAPLPAATPATPAAPAVSSTAPAASPAVAPPPAAPAAAASKAGSPQAGPVAGSILPPSPPAAAASPKKKAKSAQAQHEQKAREEQLRQHQDVAKKMTFLNSFDTAPKLGQKKEKTPAAKPQPTQVKVATYRDSKTAQTKIAELQKQGVKATVKPGKDAKGCACYTVYRPAPAPAHPKEPEKVAQTKEKTGTAAPTHKPQAPAE